MTKIDKILFEEWWKLVGSGISKQPHEDSEEHAKRVALRAWDACIDVMKD